MRSGDTTNPAMDRIREIILGYLEDELIYSKREMKTQVEFTVRPNKVNIFNSEEELLDIEYLDDEIPEIDQIF